jgi:hypothetical protein
VIKEEKITVWKCPNCNRMMALDENCDGCKMSVDEYTFDIDFEEVTKQVYEAARSNAKAI